MDLSELDMIPPPAAILLRLSSQLTGCPFEFFILSRNNQHPLTERASSECFKRIVTATAGKTWYCPHGGDIRFFYACEEWLNKGCYRDARAKPEEDYLFRQIVFFGFFCFFLTAKITALAPLSGMDTAIRTRAMLVAVVFIYANTYISEYYV